MCLPNLTLMLNRLNLLNFKLFTQKVDLKEFHVTSYNPIGFNLDQSGIYIKVKNQVYASFEMELSSVKSFPQFCFDSDPSKIEHIDLTLIPPLTEQTFQHQNIRIVRDNPHSNLGAVYFKPDTYLGL